MLYCEALMRVKRKALSDGRTFKSSVQLNESTVAAAKASDSIPKSRCGYRLETLHRQQVCITMKVDTRGLVSLACWDRTAGYLQAYASKLPLMCINVSRLIYTTDAFVYRYRSTDATTDALQFYIGTDIHEENPVYASDCPPDESSLPPSNELFSNLVHRLRQTGYEEYVFALADHLQLNVDLVKCDNLLFRYTRSTPPTFGVLTAVRYETDWYVKTTADHLINTI